MNVTCEKLDRTNTKEGSSVVTIISSYGEVVDRITVPHIDGVWYCTEHPDTDEGTRYSKALAKAKLRDKTPLDDNAKVWRSVKFLKPSKSGYYWVSDGIEVWAATVSTNAQVNSIASQDQAKFFLPIAEDAPMLPKVLSLH